MEKYYSIAIRKKQNPNDIFFKHNSFEFIELNIDTHGRYWLADPFLFENDGITYVFYEAFDFITRRGYIGYSIIKDDLTATPVKIVLKRKNHFSFPYIFKKNGNIFMMPESSGTNNLVIYKAINFPNSWEEYRNLLDDVFYVDSIMFDYNDNNYLISSEQFIKPDKNLLVSCYVKNLLFKVNPDSVEYIGKISEGDYGIRNAGSIIKIDDQFIRVGQDCTDKIYGKGICFFKIKSVNPYQEDEIFHIDYKEMNSHIIYNSEKKDILGTHTYNATNKYEIIDFSYYDTILFKYSFLNKFNYYYRIWEYYQDLFKTNFRKAICYLPIIINKPKSYYVSKIDNEKPWAIVTYIAHPFYYRNNVSILNTHQNKREVLVMEKVFHQLGYNVYFMDSNADIDFPNLNCKIVFGHEPGFSKACKKYPNAKKVYYGVSTYFEYRNNTIKKMTDEFNQLFSVNAPYKRLVSPHDSINLCDKILLIGSNTTVNTYPENIRDKVTIINQSTTAFRRIKYPSSNYNHDFLYFSGPPNTFKGLAPLYSYFSKHPDLTLHWVGPVDEELSSLIPDFPANIISYGFQNIDSDLMQGLLQKCDFIIYPSGVEGSPGAVINVMKSGLIPIVSSYASFNGIEELGYVLEDITEEAIDKGVNWALGLSDEEKQHKRLKSQEYVEKTFNLENFNIQFYNYMSKVVNGKDTN